MAISTPRDNNRIPALLGTLNTDGKTVVPIAVNPATHGLVIMDGTTGSSITTTNAQKDANRASAIWGISSADGVTPISIYCDSTGRLLTKTT